MQNNEDVKFDMTDIIKKTFKYFIYGFIIGIACKYIPNNKLSNREIIMISIVASVSFAILDIYTPSISFQ